MLSHCAELVIVGQIELLAFEIGSEKLDRHEQLGRKPIGLHLVAIYSFFRNTVAQPHPESPVHVNLVAFMQQQVPKLMSDREPLPNRSLVLIDTNHGF